MSEVISSICTNPNFCKLLIAFEVLEEKKEPMQMTKEVYEFMSRFYTDHAYANVFKDINEIKNGMTIPAACGKI